MRNWRLSTFEVDVLASDCVDAIGLRGNRAWPAIRPLTQDGPSGHALADLPAEGTLPTVYLSYGYRGASGGARDSANAEPGCDCGSAKQLGRAAQEKRRTAAEAPWCTEPARTHEALRRLHTESISCRLKVRRPGKLSWKLRSRAAVQEFRSLLLQDAPSRMIEVQDFHVGALTEYQWQCRRIAQPVLS